MPLRPFPFQLGIGTDIVHVRRVRAVLKQGDGAFQQLQRYIRRFLTVREQHNFWSHYGRWDLTAKKESDIIARHLAGRWAAKEATIKAVCWRKLNFHDIVIKRPDFGGGMHAIILDKPSSADQHLHQDANERKLGLGTNHRDELSDKAEAFEVSQDPTSITKSYVPNASVPERLQTASMEVEFSSPGVTKTFEDLTTSDEQYGDLSGQVAQISISHDGDYATAVCLAAEETMDGDVGGEAAARNHL